MKNNKDLISFKIIGIKELVFEGAVFYVNLPAAKGQMILLPKHTPMVVRLKAGTVRWRGHHGNMQEHAIEGGICHIHPYRPEKGTDCTLVLNAA